MQCPTCGKRVPRGQAVCSYCGALVGSADLGTFREDGPVITAPQTTQRWGMPPEATREEEKKLEDRGEIPPVPSSPSKSPRRESPRPRPPSWIRILFPLAFILIPLLNFLWNSSFRTGSRQPPVLRQALLCEGIRNGRPVNPKEVFSLQKDRQLVLYSLWSGDRGDHSYVPRWYSPDGKIQPLSETSTSYRSGRNGFYAYSIFPLKPGMALGKWRVEIRMDDGVQAQLSFELRE